MKFSCYGQVVGSKYLGEVEADSLEEAKDKAQELDAAKHVSVCHQCSDQIEDPEIHEIFVYPT